MAEPKTKPTRRSAKAFVDAIPDEQKRKDSAVLLGLLAKATSQPPRMWGDSMVGFGTYIKRLADVDVKVLDRLVGAAVKEARVQAQAEARDRARATKRGRA